MSRRKQSYDLTGQASQKKNEDATAAARQAESDDLYEGPDLEHTPSQEDDGAGENRVTTSISDD